MSTFEKTNNVESHEDLVGYTKIDEGKKSTENFIIEFKEKMKTQIVKDEEEAYKIYCNMHTLKVSAILFYMWFGC